MSSRYLLPPAEPKSVGTAYLLWALGIFGICGVHRLYLGKIGTGVLWLLTFGLLGIGQFIDLFLIPGMVDDHNFKLAVLQGIRPSPAPAKGVSAPPQPLKGQALMREILRLAQRRQGILTLSEIAIELTADFDEIEKALRELSRRGIAFPENNLTTGAVEYHFPHLLRSPGDQRSL